MHFIDDMIMHMNKDIIETNRLILRKLTMDDAQAMFDGWCSDPEVTKYVTFNPHENVEVTKMLLSSWIKEYDNPDTIRFGITLKDSETLIGCIDVVRYVDGCPEVGYCLTSKYWNNGYMTEALSALLEYMFDKGYKKIVMAAIDKNIGSNRVIQKCGFKFTHQEIRTPHSWCKPETITLNWYEKTI